MSNASKENLSKSLRRDGIVVVDDYLKETRCDELKEKIDNRIENGIRTSNPSMGYADMAEADEPILNQRSGDRDDGMIDIFNMDLVVPKLSDLKDDNFIIEVINNAEQKKYTVDSLNVYVNRSVTNTRNYHADTYDGKYKFFIYLTDVQDLSYGPFSYVKKSHQPSRARRIFRSYTNKIIRGVPSTNAVTYDESNKKICTAPKGTLIIANQAGLHRGMPQEEGKERIMISAHCVPQSHE